jgi:hypothetical protein
MNPLLLIVTLLIALTWLITTEETGPSSRGE